MELFGPSFDQEDGERPFGSDLPWPDNNPMLRLDTYGNDGSILEPHMRQSCVTQAISVIGGDMPNRFAGQAQPSSGSRTASITGLQQQPFQEAQLPVKNMNMTQQKEILAGLEGPGSSNE